MTGAPENLARIIRTEKPHLVLLDLVLPTSDCIELIRHVPELSDLPVIFISAYRRDETVEQALEDGAADYIAKSFSPTELVARVQATLSRRVAARPFAVGGLAIEYVKRRVRSAEKRSNTPPPRTRCSVCSRSTPHGSWPSKPCFAACGSSATAPMRT